MIERDGKDYPSNAFAILTGNGGLHVATQCGVFNGATIVGIYRQDIYEIPPDAIRELIINAMVHRSYHESD